MSLILAKPMPSKVNLKRFADNEITVFLFPLMFLRNFLLTPRLTPQAGCFFIFQTYFPSTQLNRFFLARGTSTHLIIASIPKLSIDSSVRLDSLERPSKKASLPSFLISLTLSRTKLKCLGSSLSKTIARSPIPANINARRVKNSDALFPVKNIHPALNRPSKTTIGIKLVTFCTFLSLSSTIVKSLSQVGISKRKIRLLKQVFSP